MYGFNLKSFVLLKSKYCKTKKGCLETIMFFKHTSYKPDIVGGFLRDRKSDIVTRQLSTATELFEQPTVWKGSAIG